MIRILLAALLGLLAVSPASAQKTKAAIQTEITTLFADNTTGLLTPAKLRTVTTDIVNSYVDWLTCTTGGGLVYWAGGTPTCLLAGTVGQVLKTNGASPPSWADVSSNILAGTNISITGTSPATVAVVGNPTFAGNVTAPTLNGNTFTTGTYTLTGTAAKTLTFNNSLTLAGVDTKTLTVNNSLALAGTDGTTQTFQASDTIVGRATTDTLTNKTFDTAGAGNSLLINGTAITSNTGTGSNVLATTPTISQPNIVGTTTNNSAAAGSVGEYVESVIAVGSATNNTTNVAKNVTSISLTAGDWDVDGVVQWNTSATTNITFLAGSISLTTGTTDFTAGRGTQFAYPAFVPGAVTAITAGPIPPVRFSLSGTTTIFLVSQATFTVSTIAPYGILRARRVR